MFIHEYSGTKTYADIYFWVSYVVIQSATYCDFWRPRPSLYYRATPLQVVVVTIYYLLALPALMAYTEPLHVAQCRCFVFINKTYRAGSTRSDLTGEFRKFLLELQRCIMHIRFRRPPRTKMIFLSHAPTSMVAPL